MFKGGYGPWGISYIDRSLQRFTCACDPGEAPPKVDNSKGLAAHAKNPGHLKMEKRSPRMCQRMRSLAMPPRSWQRHGRPAATRRQPERNDHGRQDSADGHSNRDRNRTAKQRRHPATAAMDGSSNDYGYEVAIISSATGMCPEEPHTWHAFTAL